jgi:hypothetical protein
MNVEENMTESENIKYQLEVLASYEPNDLDNPELEVAYENEAGNEGFLTVCCIDLAKRSIELIEKIEAQANELKYEVERQKIEISIMIKDKYCQTR